jgi:hypothetical protein
MLALSITNSLVPALFENVNITDVIQLKDPVTPLTHFDKKYLALDVPRYQFDIIFPENSLGRRRELIKLFHKLKEANETQVV